MSLRNCCGYTHLAHSMIEVEAFEDRYPSAETLLLSRHFRWVRPLLVRGCDCVQARGVTVGDEAAAAVLSPIWCRIVVLFPDDLLLRLSRSHHVLAVRGGSLNVRNHRDVKRSRSGFELAVSQNIEGKFQREILGLRFREVRRLEKRQKGSASERG